MSDEQKPGNLRPVRSPRAPISESEIARLAYAESGDEQPAPPEEPARSHEPEMTRSLAAAPVAKTGIPPAPPASSTRRKVVKSIRFSDEETSSLDRICRAMDMSESRIVREIVAPALIELEDIFRREGRGGVMRYLDNLARLARSR